MVVVAASLPAATAYGCYDDGYDYERCANGKYDPVCTKMCNQVCGPMDQGAAGAAKAPSKAWRPSSLRQVLGRSHLSETRPG